MKKPTYKELERQVLELNAQLIHVYHFASLGIAKASVNHLMGSGALIQISALGGREIVNPFVIKDGLSDETIKALKADMQRSYDLTTIFKVKE